VKVLFIGQSIPFSAEPLRALMRVHTVVAVVESVQRGQPRSLPRGRHLARWLLFPLLDGPWLDRLAARARVPYLRVTRQDIDALVTLITDTAPDVVCVASMAQLLPPAVLELLPGRFVNLHPSLLPSYRGPQPFFWQLHDDVHETGVTVHRIDAGEDTGALLAQVAFPMPVAGRDAPLPVVAGRAGGKLFLQVLDAMATGTVVGTPQPTTSPTARARSLRAGEAFIDWTTWPAARVARFLAAAAAWHMPLPHPGRSRCWTIDAIRLAPGPAPGILEREGSHWRLGCADGHLVLRKGWRLRGALLRAESSEALIS
jgi:methionyl-tRNA formyltransferase